MPGYYFISYSVADAADFALRLHDALETTTGVLAWLDKLDLPPGRDWDSGIADGIRDCEVVLFVMTDDSIKDTSNCKKEIMLALSYKKPIVPVRLRKVDLPFLLNTRQWIDFTGDFGVGMAKLREYVRRRATPIALLEDLQDRLKDAERDLTRTSDANRPRIQADIEQLRQDIERQKRIVADPAAAARRTEESIQRALEREREPAKPVSGISRTKFINPPPLTAPKYFQDRYEETKIIADALKDETCRMMMVVGRGGIGKTAMVCRLLKALEGGQLPDDLGALSVDGIVYLSARGMREINVPNLYGDVSKLLLDEKAKELDALYRNPQVSTAPKMQALLAAFPHGRVVVLLDNFEDVIDPATQNLTDAELDEALRTLLTAPNHGVKVILTTRIAPHDLALLEPARQCRINLDEGLESPFAENILRGMDADGKVGLKTAPDALLNRARAYTRGFPRALEALYAILSADRYTSLAEILGSPMPTNVTEALVGEAFSRLDPTAERVMQGLAIFNRPVTPAAVDYVLQPYVPGIDSAPVLNRLVNMQFVHRDAGRYYQHQVDRTYAVSRVTRGEQSDRNEIPKPRWTQFALLHRGAEYFKQVRKPREELTKIDDLGPQLSEFDLRCGAEDYNTAANVLLEIDFDYLMLWGCYQLMAEMHERLQNRLSDPLLDQFGSNRLGVAYAHLGKIEKAINCQQHALNIAIERKDRSNAGVYFGNLGNCYSEIGHSARAIEYYGQAIIIDRETKDRRGEGIDLGNIGNQYAALGMSRHAFDCLNKALTIARETGNRQEEARNLAGIANSFIDEGHCIEAIESASQSVVIAEETKSNLLGSYGNRFLALALLYAGNLSAARIAAETARQYDEPKNNYSVHTLLGVIALRQGDHMVAKVAFESAVTQARQLLARTAQNFRAHDAEGLALCGLGLVTDAETDKRIERMAEAVAAFRAARAINKDAGIVARVVRLLDALVLADPQGAEKLAEARRAASGEG